MRGSGTLEIGGALLGVFKTCDHHFPARTQRQEEQIGNLGKTNKTQMAIMGWVHATCRHGPSFDSRKAGDGRFEKLGFMFLF